VIDAREQSIQRPRGQKRQKPYYSKKRKRHTLKTQIVVTKSGQVLWVSESVPGGRVHDNRLLKRSRVMERLPKQVTKRVDLGYQGVETDYPDHAVVIPKKKPPKQELTPSQKRQNRKKAKRRIVVEPTLAHLKQFQVLSQTYRNRRGTNNQSYNRKIRIVAGLVNLRYESRTA
jgi:transposase